METRSRLLDVGNCTPDHTSIRAMLEKHFDVAIDRVMFVADALKKLAENHYDLVLVNRPIFDDNSPGMALVEAMQTDPKLKSTPIMVISNYEDAQATAVKAGAQPGFGKASLEDPKSVERLSKFLRRKRI